MLATIIITYDYVNWSIIVAKLMVEWFKEINSQGTRTLSWEENTRVSSLPLLASREMGKLPTVSGYRTKAPASGLHCLASHGAWETHSPASADSSMPPQRATVETASLFSMRNRVLLYASLPCLLIWVSEPVSRNSLSTTSPQTVSTLNALQTSREAASLIKTMKSLERCLLREYTINNIHYQMRSTPAGTRCRALCDVLCASFPTQKTLNYRETERFHLFLSFITPP